MANSSTSPIVKFVNVHKGFGSQKVLRGVSLEIPRKKITFVVGRSGEGKSVTLKHIVGVLVPDKGDVFVDEESMSNASIKDWIRVRKKLGLLFQDGALFDSLSVFENVAFALREFSSFSESDLSQEVGRLLNLVGLSGIENMFPPDLSIGQKKRVGLARALSMKPKILLYDEPTTSMDPLISEHIDELITTTQRKNPEMASVVISHDIRAITSVAEYIVFLHEGVVYFQGEAQDFFKCDDPVIKQFLSGSKEGPLSRVIA